MAGTAAGFVLPGWLARAFAQDHGDAHEVDLDPPRAPRAPTTSLATLSAAYREAQRLGKPLLVFVVPDESSPEFWRRPRAFGEALNHGGDELMVALSMVHVVCARMSELRQLVPTTPAGEPMMVLVETGGVPAAARAIDPALSFDNPEQGVGAEGWQRRSATEERLIDARIASFTRALVAAITPSSAALAARARRARAHAAPATLAAIDRAIQRGALVDVPAADAAAAVLAHSAATATPIVRRRLRESLVRAAQARLRASPVPGSLWAGGRGCGITLEGVQESVMIGCGMGSMPARSSRFLFFYTRVYD